MARSKKENFEFRQQQRLIFEQECKLDKINIKIQESNLDKTKIEIRLKQLAFEKELLEENIHTMKLGNDDMDDKSLA